MASPSLLTSGAHIIERIWKSTMLSDMSKRVSLAASAERIASLAGHDPLTIVRLMRIISPVVAAAILDGLGNQPAAGRVAEDDEAAVGLDENGKQAVQQLRQHLFHGQGLAQVLADLQQGLELGLGVDAQAEAGGAAGNVDLGHDASNCAARLFVVDQHGRRLGRLVLPLGHGHLQVGRPVVKDEHQVADAQLVVFAERFPPQQRPAVEQACRCGCGGPRRRTCRRPGGCGRVGG